MKEMKEILEQMIGKTVSGFDITSEELRIDFSDGTHLDLDVVGGDGGIGAEWIDDQEISDRSRSAEIMDRVTRFHEEAKTQGPSVPVLGWNGWLRLTVRPDLTAEEVEFMATRKGK